MIFHLAIPAKDLSDSIRFYRVLGGKLGRQYAGVAIFNFHDIQLVLHVSDQYDQNPQMYPRHFGFILKKREHFDEAIDALSEVELKSIYKAPFVRQRGLESEHETFFLKDPANNLIEFKWYKNPEMIFS